MPYIDQKGRQRLWEDVPQNAGELNYAITQIIDQYRYTKGFDYQAVNDVIGALEGAKLEFYRRVAAPYEDTKIQENGDVY